MLTKVSEPMSKSILKISTHIYSSLLFFLGIPSTDVQSILNEVVISLATSAHLVPTGLDMMDWRQDELLQ